MTTCRGCGIILQNTDPGAPGYTPRADSLYCRRCFRLIHYDDLTVSMRRGIDPDTVLKEASATEGMILWTVDLFDLEAGMIPGLSRKLPDRDILLVCTKRDLLPEDISNHKLAEFVFSRLREYGIKVKGLVFSSPDRESAGAVMEEALRIAEGRDIIVIGRANSGKSTLLNNLCGEKVLAASRYPGTTLAFNRITIGDTVFIDTPGLEIENSILMCTAEEDLKQIVPRRRIKPRVYQVKKDQTFMIGGLVRIGLQECERASCVFYVSDELYLHRTRSDNADEVWKEHYGKMLSPVPLTENVRTYTVKKEYEKTDVVIDGLGWLCLSGGIARITVTAPEGVNVTFRKAML